MCVDGVMRLLETQRYIYNKPKLQRFPQLADKEKDLEQGSQEIWRWWEQNNWTLKRNCKCWKRQPGPGGRHVFTPHTALLSYFWKPLKSSPFLEFLATQWHYSTSTLQDGTQTKNSFTRWKHLAILQRVTAGTMNISSIWRSWLAW